MVQVCPPPPTRDVTPCFYDIPAGSQLVRIFDPTQRGANALTFRCYGPVVRFDHHRGVGQNRKACDDPERSVYYTSWSNDFGDAFSSCLVERFGDTGVVKTGENRVAMPLLNRDLHLLDLRFNGAMLAGTVAAISKCEHRLSQPWSRYFYETINTFGIIDGMIYLNAHNDGPALLLYERAQDALMCPDEFIIRLDDRELRQILVDTMAKNSLTWSN